MTSDAPPPWLQRMLLLFLNPRDRDTISGDLLEEYREEKLPRLGSGQANNWYVRQLISLTTNQIVGGPLVKQLLTLSSLFTVAAGVWLGVMESILKHPGYVGRSVIAACIAVQGLATLACILLGGRSAFRNIVMMGAVAIAFLGGWAILRILGTQHFEGFVLIIGAALVTQGILTVATLWQTPETMSLR